MMTLDRRIKSQDAQLFKDSIVGILIKSENRQRARKTKDQSVFDLCVEAVAADLVRSLFVKKSP